MFKALERKKERKNFSKCLKSEVRNMPSYEEYENMLNAYTNSYRNQPEL